MRSAEFHSPHPGSDGHGELQQQWTVVQAARAEYLKISGELDTIVQSGAGGIERSDGLQAISNLGRRRALAFETYKQKLLAYRKLVGAQPSPTDLPGSPALTPREREVLALIAQGKTSREIAQQLGNSFKTISCHRTRIMEKLDAHNAADLTRAAIRIGLIEP